MQTGLIIKCYEINVSVLISFYLSDEHFIPPPTECLLADLCNHTWIPQCGKDRNGLLYKFSDDCQRKEYNCDNHKAYEGVDMKECEITTANPSTTIETTTSTEIPITERTTEATKTTTHSVTVSRHHNCTRPILPPPTPAKNCSSRSTSNTEGTTTEKPTEKSTISTPKSTTSSAPTTTFSTTTELTKATTTTIKPTTEITPTTEYTTSVTIPVTSTTMRSAETTVNLTTTAIPTSTTTITESTTLTTKATTSTTKATTSTTKATISTTESTTSTTTATTPTTSITSASTTSTSPTTIISTTKVNLDVNENTIPQNKATTEKMVLNKKPCQKDGCEGPTTWETTSKGETRDFFQILRDRYGEENVKILRGTTHWPRRIMWTRNYRDSFVNGRHLDGDRNALYFRK